MCEWLSTGFGLDVGFIDHFNTQLIITFNYSAIANFHTLQITRAHSKSFPACSVFNSSCLVTVSNNGCSSASGLKFFLNGSSFPTEITSKRVSVITSQLGLHRKHCSSLAVQLFPWEHVCLRSCYWATVLVYLLIKNLLHGSGCCFVVCFEVASQQWLYTLQYVTSWSLVVNFSQSRCFETLSNYFVWSVLVTTSIIWVICMFRFLFL
jgi:hypothetical protein